MKLKHIVIHNSVSQHVNIISDLNYRRSEIVRKISERLVMVISEQRSVWDLWERL